MSIPSNSSFLNKNADAIIFDLGLSTIQLKDYTRGFSFNSEFDLDMRMDPNSTKVEDIINNCSEELLKKIIKKENLLWLNSSGMKKHSTMQIIWKKKYWPIIKINISLRESKIRLL